MPACIEVALDPTHSSTYTGILLRSENVVEVGMLIAYHEEHDILSSACVKVALDRTHSFTPTGILPPFDLNRVAHG